jgi:hypothetical protein
MTKLRDTHEFRARRDLTLSESTGMLIDATIDRAKREAEQRATASRRATREELRLLREESARKRSEAAKARRQHIRFALVIMCAITLGVGWSVANSTWSYSNPSTASSSELARD